MKKYSWAKITIYVLEEGFAVSFNQLDPESGMKFETFTIQYRNMRYFWGAHVKVGSHTKVFFRKDDGNKIVPKNGERFAALISEDERGVMIKNIAPLSELDTVLKSLGIKSVHVEPEKESDGSEHFEVDITAIKAKVCGTIPEIIDKLIIHINGNPHGLLTHPATKWYRVGNGKTYQVYPEIPQRTSEYIDFLLSNKDKLTIHKKKSA